MAKLEYKASCACGGEILLQFKKPTRFETSVERARCSSCKSEFMFWFALEYNDKGRVYVPSHEVIETTEAFKEIMKRKNQVVKNEAKEASA